MSIDSNNCEADVVGREIASFRRLLIQSVGKTVSEANLKLYCAPNVLPPNNRVSRLLADALQQCPAANVLDIGCGSGLLALVAARTADRVVGVDIDPAAVEASRYNAAANGVRNVVFLLGNMYAPVVGEKFDLIVCNPPLYPTSNRLAPDLPQTVFRSLCDDCSPSFMIGLIAGLPRHLTSTGRYLFASSSLSDNLGIERLLSSEGIVTEGQWIWRGQDGSQDVIVWSVVQGGS